MVKTVLLYGLRTESHSIIWVKKRFIQCIQTCTGWNNFHSAHPPYQAPGPFPYCCRQRHTLLRIWWRNLYNERRNRTSESTNIHLNGQNDKDLIRQIRRNGATEIALSPDAKEVAFILRGDVYVTSVEYKTTKQITNTPEQERDINFAPDGRSIVYASERNGLWQIYQASLNKKKRNNSLMLQILKRRNWPIQPLLLSSPNSVLMVKK